MTSVGNDLYIISDKSDPYIMSLGISGFVYEYPVLIHINWISNFLEIIDD